MTPVMHLMALLTPRKKACQYRLLMDVFWWEGRLSLLECLPAIKPQRLQPLHPHQHSHYLQNSPLIRLMPVAMAVHLGIQVATQAAMQVEIRAEVPVVKEE